MQINTTKGLIDEELLRKEILTERVPCGDCIKTRYFLDTELVRQDVVVRVTEGFETQGVATLKD